MKTLHLTLKKKWFDMAGNSKPEEYRELTPYWVRRLIKCNAPEEERGENKIFAENFVFDIAENGYSFDEIVPAYFAEVIQFDVVHFRNGYRPDSPVKQFKWEGLEFREGNPEWGAEPSKKYFVIKLGERIV